jgi:hypothetical protein
LSIKLAVAGQQMDKVFDSSNKKELEEFQKKLTQAVGK